MSDIELITVKVKREEYRHMRMAQDSGLATYP